MIIIAQAFASIFAILVVSRSLVDYKQKKESLQMTLFWVVIWVSVLALAFFPGLVDQIITNLGGDRTGLGTIFGMGLVFVLFVSYRIYVKANRIEKNLDKLSREFSLLPLTKPRKRTKKKKAS
jgi:hypothetical protein